MTLWLVLALMTATAIFAVLWPLGRRAPLRAGSDVAVYRDQLEEIGRDRASGLIGEREAEAARIEVSRRLIAAADAALAVTTAPAGGLWRRRAAALIAIVFLPLGAVGLYLSLGSPGLPDQPHSARLEAQPENGSIVELVARVEAHLEENPEDGRGWEILAPVYMRLGRYDDAVRARRNALRLLGETAEREADLGEAMIGVANGIVTGEAKAVFENAVKQDAGEVKARYFLGLAAEQDGRRDEAAEAWRNLLASSPPDAPWAGLVRDSLARVDPNATRGPSDEAIAAAQSMSPDARNEMVRGMVARLAERLKIDGANVDGWLQLVRAYMVLGEHDKARTAVDDARRALASEPDKLQRVDELVKGLGLEG